MDDQTAQLHLFDAYGIELEYMIVDRETLNVKPIADELIMQAAGELSSDFDDGTICWSNELALHVIELKTNGPVGSLVGFAKEFRRSLNRLNQIAEQFNSRLMPTAMHPWMDPIDDLKLWPHDNNPIYEAYNRIFDCRGHGWANLQSMHINLPFSGDDEFGRLHAAIRLVLPILPAIAASSPFADGRETGFLDYRMEVYRNNSAKIPSITGLVVPEPVFTQADYEREIFDVTYRNIAPYDPDGFLQHPFLNSRGAIARFDRGAIEIRVIDVQECPEVDCAIAETVTKLVQLLVSESVSSFSQQKAMATIPLANIFFDVVCNAEKSIIRDHRYLDLIGVSSSHATAKEVWAELISRLIQHPIREPLSAKTVSVMQTITKDGPLARRITEAVCHNVDRLPAVYGKLCDCLQQGKMFLAENETSL
ncbi:MAG TPA: glutamate--cysteine ligase [Planctomycetaceae bacterium]|nr:glutamate--cysteine ligase [Planctomycetaceae bacterium]